MAPEGDRTRKPLNTAAQYGALGLAGAPEYPPTCSCTSPAKRPFDPVTGRHLDGWQQRGIPTGAELHARFAVPGADRWIPRPRSVGPVPSRQDPIIAPESAPTPDLPAGWQADPLRAWSQCWRPAWPIPASTWTRPLRWRSSIPRTRTCSIGNSAWPWRRGPPAGRSNLHRVRLAASSRPRSRVLPPARRLRCSQSP